MKEDILHPPKLLLVALVYLGLGPLLWLLPVTLCSTPGNWGEFSTTFNDASVLLLPVAIPFLSGVIWWGALFMGLWYLTVSPTLIAAYGYWFAMRTISIYWRPAFSKRLYRSVLSGAVAAITATVAFGLATYPGIFSITSTAFIEAWSPAHLSSLSGLFVAVAMTGAQLGLVIGWWMVDKPDLIDAVPARTG